MKPWWNPRGTLPHGRPGPPGSLSGLRSQSFQLLWKKGSQQQRRPTNAAAHSHSRMATTPQACGASSSTTEATTQRLKLCSWGREQNLVQPDLTKCCPATNSPKQSGPGKGFGSLCRPPSGGGCVSKWRTLFGGFQKDTYRKSTTKGPTTSNRAPTRLRHAVLYVGPEEGNRSSVEILHPVSKTSNNLCRAETFLHIGQQTAAFTQ